MAKFKPPKQLGACADLLYKLKQERLKQQKKVDDIAKQEADVKEYIINTLPKSKASGVAGKLARVTVVPKETPRVTDWEKFYKYITKTKSFELLQRRTANAAINERWDAGKEVPGIEHFKYKDISLNKV